MASQDPNFSEFEDVLNTNGEENLKSIYTPEASLLKTLEGFVGSNSISNFSNRNLLKFVEEQNLYKIARLLDVHFAAALQKIEAQAELFFTLLESTVDMLSLELGNKFWTYLETRHSGIAELAQGSNSIFLLRACRSFLARHDPELYKEASGRVLQFLAVSKGFAHPSRLNKKGKVFCQLAGSEDTNSTKDITPLKACQTLHNLSSLSRNDTLSFLSFLDKKTQRTPAGGNAIQSVEFDIHSWQWTDRNCSSGYRLLAEQILIALSTIVRNISEDEELQMGMSKLTKNCQRILEQNHKMALSRVFYTEELWRKWKQNQCPYIEYKPETSPPKTVEGQDVLLLGTKEGTEPLLNCIGNTRLTRLLQAKVSTEDFFTNKDTTAQAERFRAESKQSKSKSEQDSLEFSAMRCESWKRILETQAAEEVNQHEDLKQAEAELLSQTAASSTAVKRAPSTTSQEPVHKRPRIAYEEDARYQDRQRGLQTTARPLPY